MDDAESDPTLDDLAATATRAVRAAGDYLAEAFRDDSIAADYGVDDVKSAADRAAEERALSAIREDYPAHAIHSEEFGREGNHRYEWVVDPLDGTNNFAAGLPSFAAAACVRRDGAPVVSAIHEPLLDSLYLARRGSGATVDGDPLSAESDRPLSRGTVSFVVGLPALRDADRRATADRVREAIEPRCRRVLETWSPCVDWGLLARGGIEGLVAYRPDAYEQYAGELLAAESGVRHRAFDPDDGAPIGGGSADAHGTADDDGTIADADGTTADGATGVGVLHVAATDREKLDELATAARSALDGDGP